MPKSQEQNLMHGAFQLFGETYEYPFLNIQGALNVRYRGVGVA